MKETLILVIASLVRRLVGTELWAMVTIAVQHLDADAEKTGSEKRATVYETARMLAENYAGWMIGLAIEAAVARLRTQK